MRAAARILRHQLGRHTSRTAFSAGRYLRCFPYSRSKLLFRSSGTINAPIIEMLSAWPMPAKVPVSSMKMCISCYSGSK